MSPISNYSTRVDAMPVNTNGNEPITINLNKTAFSVKNEECVREALKKSWPASILIASYKIKDVITGVTTVIGNYFEVYGPTMDTPKASPQQKNYSKEIMVKTLKLVNRLLVIDQQAQTKKPGEFYKGITSKDLHHTVLQLSDIHPAPEVKL